MWANSAVPSPGLVGASENPKPGMDGITICNSKVNKTHFPVFKTDWVTRNQTFSIYIVSKNGLKYILGSPHTCTLSLELQ